MLSDNPAPEELPAIGANINGWDKFELEEFDNSQAGYKSYRA